MRSSLVAAVLALLTTFAVDARAQGMIDQQRNEEARRHYRIGQDLMLKETFEEAVREFRTAVQLDPSYSLAHYSLGQALMALKRYPEALEAYTTCRDTLFHASSMDQKTKAALDTQRRDEIRELEDSIDRVRTGKIKGSTPGQEVALEQRLRLLKDADMKGAEQGVRVPAEVSLALGSAYFRLNRLQEAETEYKAAISADKKMGPAHNNLAVIYMSSGRLQEAEQEMKLAEKSGFTVSPQFKDDLKAKQKTQKN
jgi:tetratricopeptide (TPR) repeat protein